MLQSIECCWYYAGFDVKGILQEAGSLEKTVSRDVWPIFGSFKCICSVQELHRLCLSFSLSLVPPSVQCSLTPCGYSLGASRSQSTDHFRCSSARLQPPSGIFPVPSFHSIRSFPACFTLLVSSSQSVNKTTYKWNLLLALKLWWISPIELGHTFFRSGWTVSQFIAKLQRYL